MARFLDPPKPRELIPAEKIDKEYKAMRLKVFLGAFLGYAAYYLVRKNLSLAAPDMINDGILDAGKVGLAMSAVSIAYAFSKFVMGSVSDRSDARKFLCVGLVLSALTMMAVGLIPFGTNTAFNIFARAVVRKRMIPFIIESATKSDMIERGRIGFDEIKAMSLRNELPDLTLDEINEEIRRVREEKK